MQLYRPEKWPKFEQNEGQRYKIVNFDTTGALKTAKKSKNLGKEVKNTKTSILSLISIRKTVNPLKTWCKNKTMPRMYFARHN